jgi:hypothetical protein
MFIISLAMCMSGLLVSEQDATLAKEFESLSKLPKVRLGQYRFEPWVEAANHLKQLGKDDSLRILKAYFAKSPDHERIQLMCRLLFANPKGWDPPKFGAPGPDGIDVQAIKRFPLFPFAISDGVPFVVVGGYSSGGKIGGGKQCLDLCENLSLIKEDYSTKNWENAAKTLIRSEAFLQLYPANGRDGMIKIILNQARKPQSETVSFNDLFPRETGNISGLPFDMRNRRQGLQSLSILECL